MPLPHKDYYLLKIQDLTRTYYASFWVQHMSLPGQIRIIHRIKFPHKIIERDITCALIQLQKAVRKYIANKHENK